MDPVLFRKFKDLAYEKAGIAMNDKKESLVSARVAKRLRSLGLDSPRDYLTFLKKDESGQELVQFLDVISTNFTHFMREKDHFKILEDEVRRWRNEGRNEFRVWCAASSSGEEPYSIGITIDEASDGKRIGYKILATDISTKVLGQAKEGVYDTERLKPLSKMQRHSYFKRIGRMGDDSTKFQVTDELRSHYSFKRLNLAKPPFPMKGPLDIVFCRNVMIYFDVAVRQGLISEIERLLRPGSFLVIGHSETLTGINSNFRVVKPSVYQKMS